jgi:hypothetical protein
MRALRSYLTSTARALRVLALLCLAGVAEGQQPATVCELLNNQDVYRDRLVRVRGEWIRGPEASFLDSPECVWGDGSVSPIIDLASPNLPGRPKVPVTLDRKSFQVFAVELKRLLAGKENGEVQVFATFEGWLLVKDRLEKYRDTDGQMRIRGFGHLGACPAQLICGRVSDPEIRAKSVPGSARKK